MKIIGTWASIIHASTMASCGVTAIVTMSGKGGVGVGGTVALLLLLLAAAALLIAVLAVRHLRRRRAQPTASDTETKSRDTHA